MSLWDRDNAIPLQPPAHVKLAGRPKKKRNRDVTEVKKKGKKEVLTKWVSAKCEWCRQPCHNVRCCASKKAGNDQVPGGRTKYKNSRVAPTMLADPEMPDTPEIPTMLAA
ncbi:hypothetical protein LIER_28563 [Lithospermum erythrorhizon]|uniref:Uncharacterized protein n=1 Tax=Lithospermum erythrorhizon TaxID=34254 RepID=A0AAV3RG46_LITER